MSTPKLMSYCRSIDNINEYEPIEEGEREWARFADNNPERDWHGAGAGPSLRRLLTEIRPPCASPAVSAETRAVVACRAPKT